MNKGRGLKISGRKEGGKKEGREGGKAEDRKETRNKRTSNYQTGIFKVYIRNGIIKYTLPEIITYQTIIIALAEFSSAKNKC